MLFSFVKLVRIILNAFRKPEHKDQPMTKDEAEALVKDMAAKHPDGAHLNVATSVVDVCVALGLDASMPARKRYAQELGYPEKYNGSADANLWLRNKLIEKVAADEVEDLKDG